MTLSDLRARVRRLEALGLGVSRELAAVRRADDPMLYLERQAYLKGLTRFLGGLEDARMALALACQRIDERTDERNRQAHSA
jgi:hypothetical protein